ncbi:DUF2062 domain-containing protein [Tunturiibacter empetritectus]|uniref:DUF2062 domain-containing protein n=1 Tax=Tunturiibacter empetritectus TaxID=3069691 RepID=UPI003D9BE47C
MGASPEKLAWSLAVGLLIGINPILGSTTVLCLAVAFLLRLNIAASQLGNHIVYPLQLVLVIPFIRLASRVFNTAPMPLSANELLHAARERPSPSPVSSGYGSGTPSSSGPSSPRSQSQSSHSHSPHSCEDSSSASNTTSTRFSHQHNRTTALTSPPTSKAAAAQRSSPTPNRSCPATP